VQLVLLGGRQKLVVVEGVGEAAIIARWPGLKV